MKLKHKKLIRRLVVIGALVVAITILSLLKTNLYISEYIFSRGFSRAYIFLFGNITSWFPFSVYELLIGVVILAFLILIHKWSKLINKRRKAEFLKSLMNVFIVALVIVLIYTMTASFAYYRKDLPLPQYSGEMLDEQQTEAMIKYYLTEFQEVSDKVERDQNGKVILPYTNAELAQLFVDEYKRIGDFDGYLLKFTPRVKNIQTSIVMDYMQVSGIAITPTGEANVNKHTPTNWKLITIAHEIAHIKGVMNENQANMMAYYLALTSDNIYLRYAGYMYTASRLLEIAYFAFDEDIYKEIFDMYPQAARAERTIEYNFWDKYQTQIEKISEFFNDVYLKLSGVEEGTSSYIDYSSHGYVTNPDTGEQEYSIIEYSPVQKMYIEMYLMNNI